MIQRICDRCNKPWGYAVVKWDMSYRFSEWPNTKDLCKACFQELFPDWIQKDRGILE